MELVDLLAQLEQPDTKTAYAALLELERPSDASAALYPYLDRFIEMTGSDKYVIRVRGFRLLCKQAKWDADGKIDKNLNHISGILNDDKPTAVRQALAALRDLVPYKPALKESIKTLVLSVDPTRYKETMQGLLLRDMQSVLTLLDNTIQAKQL